MRINSGKLDLGQSAELAQAHEEECFEHDKKLRPKSDKFVVIFSFDGKNLRAGLCPSGAVGSG
jgi:hypothetical protein